jgi:DNA (cytosine-5)-methyltransferase 1
MTSLKAEGRVPRAIALENVCGALTSHDGKDFAAIGSALAKGGYRFGAVVIDAAHFLPQSRPRLFIIAVQADFPIPSQLTGKHRDPHWHPAALIKAHNKLAPSAKQAWLWWRLPTPPRRNTILADFIEDNPTGVAWHTPATTRQLVAMMSDANRAKVAAAKKAGRRMVGGVYKRTRLDAKGAKVQRAEIRFDDVAGCLRTPAGGSSRQSIMIVEGDKVRSRLLSPREAARLMGLSEDYTLPSNYNETYHLAGDGVAVPVVRHLAEHLLEPLLEASAPRVRRRAAA